MADTAAIVNFCVPNNATWQDAVEFTDPDDTQWSLTGQKFVMEVKGNRNDSGFLLELTSDNNDILIVSAALRIIKWNVDKAVIQAALPVGVYVYDLIMYDASVPAQRTMLMQGKVTVTQGITGDP